MKIIISGDGNVGTHLAKLLSREKQDIILMDDDEEKLSTLSSNFDLMTVTASPSSISGLKEVGIKEADLFIAVTPDESRNMTACMLATNLGAEKTVARIDNYEYLLPKNKEFLRSPEWAYESFGNRVIDRITTIVGVSKELSQKGIQVTQAFSIRSSLGECISDSIASSLLRNRIIISLVLRFQRQACICSALNLPFSYSASS